MITDNITFSELFTLTINEIITTCDNITRYASIPNYFKAGFTTTVTYAGRATGTLHAPQVAKYTLYATANTISEVDSTLPSTQLSDFLTELGYINLEDNIAQNDFLGFIENICLFIINKVGFSVSAYADFKYVTYLPDNVDFEYKTNKEIIKKALAEIDAHSIKNFNAILLQTMYKLIKTNAVQYSIRLSN